MAGRLYQLLQGREAVSRESVLSLLADGADPCWTGSDGKSALSLSVEREDSSLLQLLLSRTTDKQTPANVAALAMAVNAGSLDCVRVLLQPGLGDPGLVNSRMGGRGKKTPLLMAISESHREVARLLLESGADPNLCDPRGRTVVHLAAVRGSTEILHDLKHSGADMCPLDDNGNTPIHFCIHPDVIEFLHREGNKTNIRNKQGSTPLETVMRINPDLPAVALLKQLEEEDDSAQTMMERTRGGRSFWLQLMAEVARGIGWKWMVFVVIAICFFSWQLTVYLHGQSPLHLY